MQNEKMWLLPLQSSMQYCLFHIMMLCSYRTVCVCGGGSGLGGNGYLFPIVMTKMSQPNQFVEGTVYFNSRLQFITSRSSGA